ncbi:DUF6134 family protein [Thalassospira sp. MA62]|nr:DUF6134 family protein [Thalassospira sp. MA62]
MSKGIGVSVVLGMITLGFAPGSSLGVALAGTANAASPAPTETASQTATFGFANTCQSFDPIDRYGPEITFQIRRDDAPVGRHRVQFNRGKDGLQVIAQTNIDISFFGFSAYNFDYRSESIWQDDKLATLSVQVDDDGKKADVTAKHEDGKLLVTGPDGQVSVAGNIFPTDHWHCGVLQSHTVLNTITGRPNDVQIANRGKEMLRTTKSRIEATQFTYDGELKTTAWYDEHGRWVGLQFKARDGSTITYQCITCAAKSGDQG